MKFKRKPVARDTVDALKGETTYTVQCQSGDIVEVPHEEFERDYEPVKRSPSVKPRKVRKKKGGAVTA